MPRKIQRSEDPSLRALIARLNQLYSPSAPLNDAFELIMWENIGYLIDDARREILFAEFRARIGMTAEAIARAPDKILLDVAKRGGMRPKGRVERWRQIAEIVRRECAGNFAVALQSLPVVKARTLLKRFPSIGDPGADRILLFAGLDARPCVESNGLRVLVRVGAVPDRKSYAVTYRAAATALGEVSLGSRDWLITAFQVLREHGKSLCKRKEPHCVACPLDRMCAHAQATWF